MDEHILGTQPQQVNQEVFHNTLDEICARFLLNLPDSEFESFERLFFAIECAWWFYEDHCRENDKSLPEITNLRTFAKILFEHTPLLQCHIPQLNQLFEKFRLYKQEVPVCGALILNQNLTKVLLVLGWGAKGKWGFPKGKMAKDERESDCAIREVQEETGFDISSYLTESEEYLESTFQNRRVRLFIAPFVSESTNFEPRTKKEIQKIEWHDIASLPEDFTVGGGYFGVVPFVKRLKRWISKSKSKKQANPLTKIVNRESTKSRKETNTKEITSIKSTKLKQPLPADKKDHHNDVTFGKKTKKGLTSKEKELLFQAYVSSIEDPIQYDGNGVPIEDYNFPVYINHNIPQGETQVEETDIENFSDKVVKVVSQKKTSVTATFSFNRAPIMSCFVI